MSDTLPNKYLISLKKKQKQKGVMSRGYTYLPELTSFAQNLISKAVADKKSKVYTSRRDKLSRLSKDGGYLTGDGVNLEKAFKYITQFFKDLESDIKSSNSVAVSPASIVKPAASPDKPMTMAQYLKGIKDKGYKVVKNPSGSITITKIKAAAKK